MGDLFDVGIKHYSSRSGSDYLLAMSPVSACKVKLKVTTKAIRLSISFNNFFL